MRIGIIGLGGVGGYYAGLLAQSGNQVFGLARGAHLEAIRFRGIEVRTPDKCWVARMTVSDSAASLASAFEANDLLIVAVKAYSLHEVIPAIAAFVERGTTILPLLNGVDIVERLVDFGIPSEQLVGGLTYLSAARIAPGIVERRSPFQRVLVGEINGGVSPRTAGIAEVFRMAGADASAVEDLSQAIWQKFIFLVSVSAACGLARSPIGPLRDNAFGRRLIERAVREALTVARSRGIPLPDTEQYRVMDLIRSLPAEMRPSLLLDLEAGAPTEVEVLSETIARYAEKAGLATPIHDAAAASFAHKQRSQT